MERREAYAHLAHWFEYLNDDCDYEKWSQYLISKLGAYSLDVGLDVGCGGGWFTRAFERNGYSMTGMDLSAQMLDFAREQGLKEGLRSEYILGDITKVKLLKRFDFVTAINDCINYIPKEKLRAAFKNVASALKKKGVFLFDISSERKFREKIANTVCADDREDVTYLAFNKTEQDKTTMDVTLFVKRKDGAFDRLDETHVQYIYSVQEIQSALEECGFTLMSMEGHLGENASISDRICFTAIRK